ncbi:Uncharacterized protein APZ42_002581 [Daphnia magna]|uniref:Uncharacterized protein n=1 Tax=Daphnia magna TaxID=35525 RepID=A0A164I6F5_9CRUS|nr:Uncharacterized protein APZ42_002581 [Daphnia magna]
MVQCPRWVRSPLPIMFQENLGLENLIRPLQLPSLHRKLSFMEHHS